MKINIDEFRANRTWYFTFNLADADSSLLTRHLSLLSESARDVEGLYPFRTIAAVILPNHMHAIWVLPEDDGDIKRRVKYFQEGFADRLEAAGALSKQDRKSRIWHRRFWHYQIRDQIDLERHIGYIHGNPVKHEIVSHPDKWRYSTWHRFRDGGFRLWTSDSLGSAGEP